MGKKCIICGEEAKYNIKNSNECYCEECSHEHFGDISYLQKIEDEVKLLKKIVNEKLLKNLDGKDKDSEKKDKDDYYKDVDVKYTVNGKKK